jgi:putative transposase
MSNHFHLAAEVLKIEDLSGYVGRATRLYSRYFHQRYQGSGPLWERRFKSVLVQKEGYLNRLGRYIERNPVRGEMAEHAWEYGFSSAHAYVTGHDGTLVRLADHPFYALMGETAAARAATYRDYLLTDRDRAEDEALFHGEGVVVGDDYFRAQAYVRGGRVTARRVGRPRRLKT